MIGQSPVFNNLGNSFSNFDFLKNFDFGNLLNTDLTNNAIKNSVTNNAIKNSVMSNVNNLASAGANSWGNALGNVGSLLGGAGQLYGAYNSRKLGKQQIDLAKKQNQLYMDDYNRRQKEREDLNNSFSKVWG